MSCSILLCLRGLKVNIFDCLYSQNLAKTIYIFKDKHIEKQSLSAFIMHFLSLNAQIILLQKNLYKI